MSATNIAVIGLWHQGVVGAACLADLGFSVIAGDPNQAVVDGMKNGRLPVFEPGLDALVAKGLASGQLRLADDLSAAVSAADFVCLMFDTPVDDEDKSDLTGIFSVVQAIAAKLTKTAIVCVTAQVPIGTCAQLSKILDAGAGRKVGIAYSPENLRLGQAIERFKDPALPVIGADDPVVFDRLAALFAPLSKSWRRTDVATAEMLKHALNGFLGVSICFANELGNLCDAVGANGPKIAELLRLEPRVGPKAMLMPGLGFSGGTLARDLITLRSLGDRAEIDTMLLDGAWVSNQAQNRLVVKRLRQFLGDLTGKRICVLGLTYKADTSTLRRSAAVEVVRDLVAAGARVCASDPGADPVEVAALSFISFHASPFDAAAGADALVLMTPWSTYRTIDLARLRQAMHGDILFDTARLWSADAGTAAGFRYVGIGGGLLPASGKGK